MQRFTALLVITIFFSLIGLNAHADARQLNARCSLKIDGTTYMNSPCHFISDAGSDSFDDLKLLVVCPNGQSADSTTCYGYEQRVTRNGVFGVLFREGGIARLCWNGGNSRKAHDCYEGLRRNGACWTNTRAPTSGNPSQTRNVELCAWRT